MNYRLLLTISISLGFCFSLQAQRLGAKIKHELPKTLYISGGADSTLVKVAEYFSEEKRSFELEYIELEELQKKVLDPKAVFLLPFKTSTVESDYFSMSMVSGSEKAGIQKIGGDGMFLRDRNMPLIVEVRAQAEWMNTEMTLLYVSALEGLFKQGQSLNQGQINESLSTFKKGKFTRVLMTENSVIEPLRAEGRLSSVCSQGQMYPDPQILLQNEDLFDSGTLVVTSYEFKGKKVTSSFSFKDGLCYYQEGDLDEGNGHQLDMAQIMTMLKFLMN